MNIHKLINKHIFIIFTVVGIWIITLFLCIIMSDSFRQNIISEAIWVTITIVVIDRVIELKEERQRLPAQLIQIGKLISLNDELLRITLPEEAYEDTSDIYKVGAIHAYIGIRPKPDIEKNLIELSKKHIIQKSVFDSNPIKNLDQQLDDIIATSAYFIDEELLTWLLTWHNSNNNLLKMLNLVDWASKVSKTNLYEMWNSNIIATLRTRSVLTGRIKKHLGKS